MASRSPSPDRATQTCTFHYVRRELGQSALSDRRLVAYLRGLIDGHGFPRPLPTLLRGGALTQDVTRKSNWIKSAVDAWLAGFIPPDCGATLDAAALRAAAADMDDNARRLQLVGGRDFGGSAA
jgi:hypothetical protein